MYLTELFLGKGLWKLCVFWMFFKDGMSSILLNNLGLEAYPETLQSMMMVHAQCVAGKHDDTIFVLEHQPVITRGRRLQGQKIPFQDEIEKRGILVCDADRGGLLTYHGPGQIVVYFVVQLNSYAEGIQVFVEELEAILLDFFKIQGVRTSRRQGHPGIWVGERKIASLGLRVEQGVTRHGISVNICNDLSVYQLFDPCGLSGVTMTNLEVVLGRKIGTEEFQDMKNDLGRIFVQYLSGRFKTDPYKNIIVCRGGFETLPKIVDNP